MRCRYCGDEIVEDFDAPYAYRHASAPPVDTREEWGRGASGDELIDPGYTHAAEPENDQ